MTSPERKIRDYHAEHMDAIEYKTSTELEEALVNTREVVERLSQFRKLALGLRRNFGTPQEVEATIVESLMALFGCGRGTLIYSQFGDGSRDSYSLEIGCSRVAPGGRTGSEEVVAEDEDAEFALQHSVVRQALCGGEPVIVRDCLGEADSTGIDVTHSVLCYPFDLTTRRTGVIYLARSVGDSPFSDDDLACLEDFALICLPTLQQSLLRYELERRVRDSEATDGAAEVEVGAAEERDEGDDVPWVEVDNEIPKFYGLVGESPCLLKLFDLVEKIKDTDFNVCIFGESGTGKELLARAIHQSGKRLEEPFISENCGAISETLLESELFGYVKGAFTGADENRQGLFEVADGGTLFLDEVGDMSEGMQRKLLRVLQEGVIRPIGSKQTIRVDVRVLCASNRDLRTLVEKGSFRADLYYRLNVISFELPPVRERMEDVPFLVRHILNQLAQEEGLRRRLSESAMKALLSYSWPGNVREMTNVLRRVMIMGKKRIVTRKELLPLLSGGPARSYIGEGAEDSEDQIVLRIPRRTSFNDIISECEKAVLLNALRQNRWNKSRVTKILRIPRQSLYNKIAKYDLKRSPSPGAEADV